MPLGEEGDMWNWGSQQQANFEKATLLMKHIKALDISQTGLPFKSDVCVTPKVYGSGTWQRQKQGRVSLGFWSQLWERTKPPQDSTEQQLLAMYMGSSGWSLSERNDHSSQEVVLRVVWLVITQEPWPLTLPTDSWAVLKRLTLWLG